MSKKVEAKPHGIAKGTRPLEGITKPEYPKLFKDIRCWTQKEVNEQKAEINKKITEIQDKADEFCRKHGRR